MSDTIYAPATLIGRSGLSVVRLSGAGVAQALRALAGSLPAPRRASLRVLRDPQDGAQLDRAIVLWLPGPESFTGEDMAELQLHGGRAVAAGVLRALAAVPGCRLAEPGEFARRAFDHGRLDLTEVEGLADLVAAESEAQRRQALRQMEGALGRLVEDWRQRLLRLLGHIEAALDFPEDELPGGLDREVREGAAVLAAELQNYLDDGRRGERLRAGIAIAILGAPNVGKSSLLNWLAGREAAIVSTVAGTTRDVVEVQLDLAGYPVTLADTAGLRDSGDPIEREGVRRARFQAESADLTLPVFDATAPVPDPATAALVDGRAIAVLNKIDLLAGAALPALPFETHPVSVLTEAGLEDLMERLAGRVREGLEVAGSAPLVTRARHRAALEAAAVELDRAATAAGPELVAEGLRLALRAFGRITGRVDVEELLDLIFREFCIGK